MPLVELQSVEFEATIPVQLLSIEIEAVFPPELSGVQIEVEDGQVALGGVEVELDGGQVALGGAEIELEAALPVSLQGVQVEANLPLTVPFSAYKPVALEGVQIETHFVQAATEAQGFAFETRSVKVQAAGMAFESQLDPDFVPPPPPGPDPDVPIVIPPGGDEVIIILDTDLFATALEVDLKGSGPIVTGPHVAEVRRPKAMLLYGQGTEFQVDLAGNGFSSTSFALIFAQMSQDYPVTLEISHVNPGSVRTTVAGD